MILDCSSTRVLTVAFCLASAGHSASGQEADVERRLRRLEEQNRKLLQTVEQQQQTIERLQTQIEGKAPEAETTVRSSPELTFGRLRISGKGAVGYFQTQSEGSYPDGAFRADEAKLFVEAPVWDDTYIFGELDLITRDSEDEFFRLGELYVDFENLTRWWSGGRWLNLRIGRVDIPFGEEYLNRDPIDNPLVSNSLTDLWGVDEGLEIYGAAGKFSYVAAIQNGGHPILNDYDSDKSIAGRVSYDPARWLHLSASAMRTGNLNVQDDEFSEMWFGSAFFRSIGTPGETTSFQANLFELDGQTFWNSGHLKLAAGYIQYDDNDRSADNRRDAWYYYAEGKQDIFQNLYAAARFSHVIADDGLPIAGYGKWGRYFFTPMLTTDLWRLSLGLGYRWNQHLLGKVEYSFEQGELLNGEKREHENFFGAQVAFQF